MLTAAPTRSDGAANAGTLGISPTSADKPSSVPISNLALYGVSNYRYCSRHLHSVSVSMQLVPIDRTSVWARTLFYTYYKTVISLSCIIHNRALINDDSNKRATNDMKSLVPMGPWQEGPRSWLLGSAVLHAPRPDSQMSLKAHGSSGLMPPCQAMARIIRGVARRWDDLGWEQR